MMNGHSQSCSQTTWFHIFDDLTDVLSTNINKSVALEASTININENNSLFILAHSAIHNHALKETVNASSPVKAGFHQLSYLITH